MSTTGRFSPIFRTGGSADSAFEKILESLNLARGTAYAAYDLTRTDTAVYVENYAIAKAINDLWESNQRLANQFDPTRMGPYIERWESILGILRVLPDTLEQRKAVIGARIALLANTPIHQAVADLARAYLGDMFVEIVNHTVADNLGGVPGGATVPGGVTLPDDLWFSPIAICAVRSWQVRDKNNNYIYDEKEYIKRITQLSYVLDGFLPAYMLATTFRYIYQGDGTISNGTTYEIIGSGTSFDTDLEAGMTIETVDDNDELQTYTIETVTDATHITVVEPVTTMTGCYYRIFGFFLDYTNNLNNLTFGNDPTT